MKKQIIKSVSSVFLCICLLAFSSGSPADWKILSGPPAEVAVELEIVFVYIGSNLKGTLSGKMCDECKSIQVRISPQTLYFEEPNRLQALLQARNLQGKGAVVVYDVASMAAIKLIKLPDVALDSEEE